MSSETTPEKARDLGTGVGVGRQTIVSVRGWIGRPGENRVTQTYAVLIGANSLWLREANRRLAQAALHITSTNLDRLGHDPISVLVTSAFWVAPSGWRATSTLIVAMLLVLGPIERRVGAVRWLVAFTAGHVGATLVVAIGLTVGVRSGRLDGSIAHSIDVGWSYGGMCLMGVLTYLFPQRLRGLYAGGLLGFVAIALWINPTFTAWGHLAASLIGLVVGPAIVRQRSVGADRSTRRNMPAVAFPMVGVSFPVDRVEAER